MYLMAEEFLSINGEGLNAGAMAHFIRLAGCPLSCSYCDTAWAQKPSAGRMISLDALMAIVEDSPAPFITLTGGEPLAAEGIETLIQSILDKTDKTLEIETSGFVDVRPFLRRFGDHERLCFTADYKLASSNMTHKMCLDHYVELRETDVVKYVIGSNEDLEEAIRHLRSWKSDKNPKRGAIPFFSPVYGQMEASKLVERIKEEKLSAVRVQLQLHKYIWEPNQQGV